MHSPVFALEKAIAIIVHLRLQGKIVFCENVTLNSVVWIDALTYLS